MSRKRTFGDNNKSHVNYTNVPSTHPPPLYPKYQDLNPENKNHSGKTKDEDTLHLYEKFYGEYSL